MFHDELPHHARLSYWRYLNHGYRSAYVEHRDAEEAATQSVWLANKLDRRTWWDRLLGSPAPSNSRPKSSPFTSRGPEDLDAEGRLIAHLIEGKERAPMRYGM